MAIATAVLTLGVLLPPSSLGAGSVSTTQCSLSDLKRVFGGNANPKLSDYYAGGAFIPNPPPTSAYQKAPIPTSGNISLGCFLGTTLTYDGTIDYPAISRAGWWKIYLPVTPSGWTSVKMTGKIIGGGGGGGGGWGSGAPNHATPAAAGGGGGSGYEEALSSNFTTAEMSTGSTQGTENFIEVYIGNGGNRSYFSNNWNDGRETEEHAAGWGENSILRYYDRLTSAYRLIKQVGGGQGGRGGTYGQANRGYTDGGAPNGGAGGAGRGNGNSYTGGQGGGNSEGSGGGGGYRDGWGGDGQVPGSGGGGGGAGGAGSDNAVGAPGGVGRAGIARIKLEKG